MSGQEDPYVKDLTDKHVIIQNSSSNTSHVEKSKISYLTVKRQIHINLMVEKKNFEALKKICLWKKTLNLLFELLHYKSCRYISKKGNNKNIFKKCKNMLNKELVQMLVMKKYTIYKLFCIHYNEWHHLKEITIGAQLACK